MQGDQGSGRDVIAHFTQAQVLIIVRCIIFRKTSNSIVYNVAAHGGVASESFAAALLN